MDIFSYDTCFLKKLYIISQSPYKVTSSFLSPSIYARVILVKTKTKDQKIMRLSKNIFLLIGTFTPTLVYYICEYLSECLQAKLAHSLLCHCAAAFNPKSKKVVVIFGEKGAGKTTLLLNLCIKEQFQIIGNDLTRIRAYNGKLFACGGSSWFNIRRTAILSDPLLNNSIHINESKCTSNWNNKIKILPRKLGIKEYVGIGEIERIYKIQLDKTEYYTKVLKWKGISQFLYLHENFGRYILGQTMPRQIKDNYIGSLPIYNLKSNLKVRDMIVSRLCQTNASILVGNDIETFLKVMDQ